MRIARIVTPDGPHYAYAEGDAWVPCTDPYEAFAAGGHPLAAGGPVTDAVLLAPTEPRLVVGVAQNGPGHPSPVQAWLKSPRTVVASGTPVALRRDVGRVVIEGEVAVVIGRDTADVDAERAHEHVLGLTAVNDVSNPDRAAVDPRNFESKGGVGYTPLGPWIDTEADLDHAELEVRINGALRVATGSHELPASIAECIAYVSRWMPLGPGDVIMTGAPVSAFDAEPGDLVEITVAGARLVTPCV
ncbi:fumarylacetoacetate hydrolase family protein [Diaminobutyricimonas sp. LJ205]|uniref:fumarylacetoacetate hydrolase family protein n=1 Tax=Diaminobutyricimonas sp. LJ205 TaxID=2683590 RepID=UPI0012F4A23C|nr:fumarylacetoacetate hydrolase family protein [Diaminobutyricimonas sp. LJ205]